MSDERGRRRQSALLGRQDINRQPKKRRGAQDAAPSLGLQELRDLAHLALTAPAMKTIAAQEAEEAKRPRRPEPRCKACGQATLCPHGVCLMCEPCPRCE